MNTLPTKNVRLPKLTRSAAAVMTLLAATSSNAFDIDTGNSDLQIRFDNTLRLNYAERVEARDSRIGNTAIADEGTYSFDAGEAVAKRIDLFSELDVIWQKRYGGRLSGAAWYDDAYSRSPAYNPAFRTIPSYVNNNYSDYTKRFYRGGSGEIMDAFVFGAFDVADMTLQAKLGRHTLYWGESLLLGGNLHGIAYAQNPLDLQKGFATPGTEAKELFRPLNQLSMQLQVNEELSVAMQYMLEWESFRYPEGGTYLGPVDFAFNGPVRQFVSAPLGFAYRGDAVEPRQYGEWGAAARWSPEWLDGTAGIYYRNFADKMPQAFITRAAPNNGSQYNLIYADNVHLLGFSLAKNIAGISVGAELSFRQNTPLNSQTLGVVLGLPEEGETKGPRGDTQHALINFLGVVGRTPLWDSASWLTEFTAAHYSKVRSGANTFNALGYAPCNATATAAAKDKWDGCVTRNYLGMGLGFTPTWFQVLPGVDLQAPVTYAMGLKGNSPTTFGGNQGLGNWSAGLGIDVQQQYRFDLKYIDYLGKYKDHPTNGGIAGANGFTTYLKDRGFVSLTFKTTF